MANIGIIILIIGSIVISISTIALFYHILNHHKFTKSKKEVQKNVN